MWNARDQAICSLHMDTDTDTLSRIGLVFLEIIWFEDPITEYMKVYIYIYICASSSRRENQRGKLDLDLNFNPLKSYPFRFNPL